MAYPEHLYPCAVNISQEQAVYQSIDDFLANSAGRCADITSILPFLGISYGPQQPAKPSRQQEWSCNTEQNNPRRRPLVGFPMSLVPALPDEIRHLTIVLSELLPLFKLICFAALQPDASLPLGKAMLHDFELFSQSRIALERLSDLLGANSSHHPYYYFVNRNYLTVHCEQGEFYVSLKFPERTTTTTTTTPTVMDAAILKNHWVEPFVDYLANMEATEAAGNFFAGYILYESIHAMEPSLKPAELTWRQFEEALQKRDDLFEVLTAANGKIHSVGLRRQLSGKRTVSHVLAYLWGLMVDLKLTELLATLLTQAGGTVQLTGELFQNLQAMLDSYLRSTAIFAPRGERGVSMHLLEGFPMKRPPAVTKNYLVRNIIRDKFFVIRNDYFTRLEHPTLAVTRLNLQVDLPEPPAAVASATTPLPITTTTTATATTVSSGLSPFEPCENFVDSNPPVAVPLVYMSAINYPYPYHTYSYPYR